MHFLTSLIIVIGFAIVVCLGLLTMIWDLWQLSFHELPLIRETPSKFADGEDAPAKLVESHESESSELSDAQRPQTP
jgi:hypothetical protein